MRQSAAQKYYCKFTRIYSGQRKKSKALEKFITMYDIYTLVLYHYSGVINAWWRFYVYMLTNFGINKAL